jgi:hypothetical protein
MRSVISDFKSKCKEWQLPYDKRDVFFVYNNDLDSLEAGNIKYILVADNPGRIEAEKERYLVGPAGMSARVYFKCAFVNDFKSEVLVLNKTPIYTSVTDKLNSLKDISYESQQYMVEMLIELQVKLNVPIIISGYSNGLDKRRDKLVINNKALKPFFENFASAVKEGRIKEYYIISHFSRDMFYHSSHICIDDFELDPKHLLTKQGEENRRMFELNIKK